MKLFMVALATIFTLGLYRPAKAEVSPTLPKSVSGNHGKSTPRVRKYGVDAAATNKGMSGWGGTSDEYSNQEYVTALPAVMKRSQDLFVNNPDIRGYYKGRTARGIGRGIKFKVTLRPKEVGLTQPQAETAADEMNRIRELHSLSGGFDATGQGRSEDKLQEIAYLTNRILGSCLVHRVVLNHPGRLLPFAIELIPGSRISTPYDKYADPCVSRGIRYTDEHRTRVVGYYVQRVPKTLGDNYIKDYEWDFIPIEDGSLMRLTEPAGIDRSLPACVAVMRSVYNRGEMVDSVIEGARTHSKYYAVTECAPGQNPLDTAEDDRSIDGASGDNTETSASGSNPPEGFVNLGGVQMLYTWNGEKVNFNSAHLPEPDFAGFMQVTDERMARGLNTAISQFTRKVDSSYSAGRQEEQMDDPAVDQEREDFFIAWRRVHEWFVDACYLSGAVDMPGYSEATRPYWIQARAEAPGRIHINPVDTMNARRMGYALRTLTPQQACEEDGKNLKENLRQWAQAIKEVRAMEAEHGLVEGTLDFLLDIPVKEAVSQTNRDGDGDGIVGEGREGRKGGSSDATFRLTRKTA